MGFTDSRAALDDFTANPPDLMMIDLAMPQISGFDLLQLISAYREGVFLPVVIVSGDITTATRRRALELGANDFFMKPFDPMAIILRVGNLLETRALHLELSSVNAFLNEELRDRAVQEHEAAGQREAKIARIAGVLGKKDLVILFQPVCDLHTGDVVGVEALSRFPSEPGRSPDVWFADAAEVGLGVELELLAIARAVDSRKRIPSHVYLAVNASAEMIADERLDEVISTRAGDLVVELTEHSVVDDYASLLVRRNELSALGARLAIDDAGAGFSTLSHILQLSPEIIKLDIALTRGIGDDPVRRALAGALVSFASDIGADLIAEGVETASELQTLRRLGVRYGQGFYLARPGPTNKVPRRVSLGEAA